MNKTASDSQDTQTSTVANATGQKQQKKQARREAKTMLAIEQAKASLEKAERKLARAQARIESRTARLRNLEAKLARLRASHQESQVSTPHPGFDHQQGQPEQESVTPGYDGHAASASDHEQETQPGTTTPAGGRTDVASSAAETENPSPAASSSTNKASQLGSVSPVEERADTPSSSPETGSAATETSTAADSSSVEMPEDDILTVDETQAE